MARAKKAAPVAPESESETVISIISGIDMIPLGRLLRAPENVRHTDKAVDVESLADDIAAHGLLQNLIGYAGDTDIDKAAVYIVGGGRRLQALDLLYRRGAIDHAFPVPVLLRTAAEAIDLSLSENLAKRDMNPADEFLAFQALMQSGTVTPADLAKKFGFSERYVRQRLRLAALAPDILDAMRAGKLTIDAAMAYAESQDHKLQLRVFAVEDKKSYEPHKAWNIRFAYQSQQMTTSDALFKLVGAKRYEEQGGQYEDDLFADAERYGNRKVMHSAIVLSVARAVAEYQKPRLLREAQKGFPTTSDVLIPPAIRQGAMPKPPKGFKLVDKGYRYNLPGYDDLRKTATEKGIDIVAVASVDREGEFKIEQRFFVPAGRLDDVIPPPGQEKPSETPEQIAARRRLGEVRSVAAFLAARKIRDDKIEGRQFWTNVRPSLWHSQDVAGVGKCFPVGIQVMVTEADIAAQMAAAEEQLDKQEALDAARRDMEERARAEREDRRSAILALPEIPAVILVDEAPYFRQADGTFADARDVDHDADEGSVFNNIEELLAGADIIGPHWPSVEAYDAEAVEEQAA
jgi:ParB/RepB/Spo0J family partition protein